jgi:DNA modification methylase
MANYTIHTGDNQQILDLYPDNHFDAIITDPPYGIEFLGKDWDANTGAVESWRQCLRVLKPGGYLLAFSAARTYHHLASNIESVGFEIRDQLMWLYASGFPKAQDIGRSIERRKGVTPSHFEYRKQKDNTRSVESHSNGTSPYCSICKKYTVTRCDQCPPEPTNQWSGWKTALKPAHEPIVMARKPFKGSCIDNVLTHGVGALNIDATRIAFENNDKEKLQKWANKWDSGISKTEGFDVYGNSTHEVNEQGRFPSNVLGEIEGYQKYFYCPKVSRRERHVGYEQTAIPVVNQGTKGLIGPNGEMNHDRARQSKVGNNHPTVKPVALMRYLIQLVAPKNSIILDPFTGSGSTGMAAVELEHTFVGCELDSHYVTIAKRRIEGWISTEGKPNEPNLPRMCGPGGDQWVHTQHQQYDRPNPQDLFEEESE